MSEMAVQAFSVFHSNFIIWSLSKWIGDLNVDSVKAGYFFFINEDNSYKMQCSHHISLIVCYLVAAMCDGTQSLPFHKDPDILRLLKWHNSYHKGMVLSRVLRNMQLSVFSLRTII